MSPPLRKLSPRRILPQPRRRDCAAFYRGAVAEGVKLRCARGIDAPLNVIICENLMGADEYFAGLVKAHLNDEQKEYFDKYIGLVEPSIGRMVPLTPKELAEQNPLAVCVEEYCELPVDKKGFKGEIPHVVNMVPPQLITISSASCLLTWPCNDQPRSAELHYIGSDLGQNQLLVRALLEAARRFISSDVPLDEIYHIDCFSGLKTSCSAHNRARWPRYKTQTQRKRQARGRGQIL